MFNRNTRVLVQELVRVIVKYSRSILYVDNVINS